ncbi:MAG: purine-binding chemotaxis protein CheW [Lachnospiraceae bacterium]|nr:purine-binding chemotaxis protein CheW [Lachnospiraceae bacterium]
MNDKKELDTVEEEKKQYIIVKIGDEQYGIDIVYIDNIVRMQRITRVPKAEAHYVGIINIRGEVVPVMSARLKMGLGSDELTKQSRIIILKLELQGMVGVLVDEVKEVLMLAETDIDRNIKKSDTYINGIGKKGDELISIFEISALVDDIEE